ncbi:MAG: hypothetical protein R3E68_16285 [Burkholderiaceae bacterium]
MSFPDGNGGSRTLAFAYDATHFRRVDGATDLCFRAPSRRPPSRPGGTVFTMP